MGSLGRRLARLGSTLTTALITGLVLAAAAAADPGDAIPPGFDLFETDPEQTVFKFEGQTTIPPNFFDQGSQAFQGEVRFGGDPIVRFMSADMGDADTVVQRQDDTVVPNPGTQSSPIPIELVSLSLVSMQPITVIVNGSPQAWDVRAQASPARPSTGQMAISSQSATENAGVFDSQLRVYPKFTFTRLSDGQTRTVDVGSLPDGTRPDDPLIALNTPWRDGCIPPAFATPLSQHFCPGQTLAGRKKLTIEESQFARHGVLPVQPRLEHFLCYTTTKTNKAPLKVQLKDQFGKREAKVNRARPGELCNPARKNNEAKVKNAHDHLRCYRTDEPDPVARNVLLRNQFGPFKASVRKAGRLCLPSTKRDLSKPGVPKKQPFRVDHFQCYTIRPSGQFQPRDVNVKDQFGARKLKLVKPSRLCAPVSKNGGAINHRVRHLVCYTPLNTPDVKRNVRVRNQFGREEFETRHVSSVCLPTNKVLLPK